MEYDTIVHYEERYYEEADHPHKFNILNFDSKKEMDEFSTFLGEYVEKNS